MRIHYLAILCFCTLLSTNAQVRYATKLFEYTPAPGQFINKSPGLPANAQSILGQAAGSGKMVSLGFWGGYIVLGFDAPVKNDPDNPYGVDFTVFGNPFSGSSEPGIVQVMKDENGNGQPDDTWYELRGSNHFLSSTLRNYSMTYQNPHGTEDVPWIDNKGNNGVVEFVAYHGQEHYPMAVNFPDVDQDEYTLQGTRLKSKTAQGMVWVNDGFDYGYADNKIINRRASKDIPDNPYTLDVLEGCGGDAFDISWAVDADQQEIYLDQVDFVKVYTGVAQNAGAIGENSPEISGVAVVKPDPSINGITDVIVSNHPLNIGVNPYKAQSRWYKGHTFTFESYVVSKGLLNTNQELIWSSDHPSIATISSDGKLTGVSNGEVTITCKWALDPSIQRTFNILIEEGVPTAIDNTNDVQLAVYPNPASHFIRIKGADNARIVMYDMTGHQVMHRQVYKENQKVDLSALNSGLYIIQIEQLNVTKTLKLIKR
ncbi:MAG: T9SS type A sorting domain-containing protein [Marinifilum sp.]|jgi:hypothetical protein|nr:T9SS type A sorting domain-containing protein [Marinifilum sp.]